MIPLDEAAVCVRLILALSTLTRGPNAHIAHADFLRSSRGYTKTNITFMS
ncbi:hypothetical protein B005_0808 [Nocardiopsis alba ATCC BAA-2165]|uniref:Uncharacterized protein n=1 Tax=Nocardiopsis alba (strain ATCC BAA-2165 / BE74) TaxID=1205910 RepID=J7LE06_NOCAA|nr:hypothetical protein B005_0808 [Nocardiopsis alba ATCC BAA-2165]